MARPDWFFDLDNRAECAKQRYRRGSRNKKRQRRANAIMTAREVVSQLVSAQYSQQREREQKPLRQWTEIAGGGFSQNRKRGGDQRADDRRVVLYLN
jgi:hypothetical protein